MELVNSLRQRRGAYVGVGLTQPDCEAPKSFIGREPGRLGALPAIVFAGAFVGYILIGIVCVLSPPSTPTSVAGIPMTSNATCLRAARHSDYVAVEINVGSPGRRLHVLVRWDKVVEPPASPLRLFDARTVESRSMQCDGLNTSCADTIFASLGDPNTGFQRMVAMFDYTAQAVEQAAYGVAGYQLALGGEMYMMKGYRYWMTPTHVCYASTPDNVPAMTSGGLRASVTAGYVVAPASSLAHVTAELLGSSYAREATVNFLCDNTTLGSVGPVAIMPAVASVENAYLSLSDRHLYETEPSAISIRRKLVEIGTACAAVLPWYERSYNLYLLDCNNAAARCATGASLPYRRIARLNMVALYDGAGSVLYYFEKSPTMSSLPSLAVSADAIGLAIIKLVLVLLAAALVWMRSDRVTSKPHWLYRHCIQAAHCVDVPDVPSVSVLEDAAIGLTAIVSRFAVALWRLDTLQYDSQSRVCYFEIIASALSFTHWMARYWMIDPWLPELVNGKPDGRGPLTRLGGSSAIADTSSCVLLAFSEAPMLVTAIPRFEPTARLLIGMLISMVSLPRCLFSASCCSLLYEAGEVGKSRIEPAFKLLLVLSIVFWILQLAALSVAINDLVVTPLGFSIGRGLEGGTGWVSVALSLGFVTAGAPRLLNSCVRLSEPH